MFWNLLNLMGNNNLIINKNLAKNIGLHEAIIYTDLLNKLNENIRNNILSNSFHYFVESMEDNTSLNEYQQKTAIQHLISLGLIKETSPRYFIINSDINLLIEYLADKKNNVKPELKPFEVENKEIFLSDNTIQQLKQIDLNLVTEPWLRQFSEESIIKALDVVKQNTYIRNAAGLFRKALENSWEPGKKITNTEDENIKNELMEIIKDQPAAQNFIQLYFKDLKEILKDNTKEKARNLIIRKYQLFNL